MVNITINNRKISAYEGETIMEAARRNNINIPSLCWLEGVHRVGSCRICVVEVEGAKTLQASCIVPVQEGMVIRTNTEKVRKTRKLLYELIMSDHPKECLGCARNQNCELQKLGEMISAGEGRFAGERSKSDIDDSSPSIVRDMSKCILCRRCVTVCNEIQEVGVLNVQNRGFDSIVGPAEGLALNTVNCTYCGQCTTVCPVGALQEKDSTEAVWNALFDSKKRVIVQTAPAVRAALGEEFGDEPGTLVTGKMATALRELGFDDVFDTNFAADLTIIEEGSELLERLTAALSGKQAVLPMITSCSPGWIKYVEHAWPDELDHLSTCKSPHMMLGALAKSFYARKLGIDPKDIFVVSVMPCTAKKFEITRPELSNDGLPNVDAVLTTRELARMIKEAGIDFESLEESDFDSPMGLSTGAADIFGTTGGVMEAALRTVYELVTGRELPFDGLHVKPIVGLEKIKTAEIQITDTLPQYRHFEGVTLRIAVTSGLSGARKLMEEVAAGKSPFHFIEVMGCPGGCISGGGQPRPVDDAVRKKRLEAIYREDEGKKLRKSHENPDIKRLYAEFLGSPLGHRSHELLHTHYVRRGVFNQFVEK
ncbi:MAG TPA: NADH-dependent [FeFe] hydrogenase, group A6 [Clostridiales bacterium]|nr:NADH-dependent [FeFe] hydrogenase, group A6 [Clostridiales bacterium]